MLFNSYIFVLVFLPVCIIGYFLLNHFAEPYAGKLFLLGMSLWFYGYFNIVYLPIILVSMIVNYMVYVLLKSLWKPRVRMVLLILAIIIDIGILFYFKYYGFFAENINTVFRCDLTAKDLVLPLGISFFTFQQLSFVIDAYRREISDYHWLEYGLFVTYFPQLIAGPIVTHDQLISQFIDRDRGKINWNNMASGLYLFALGMAKKVLIADTFGNAANWGFSNIGQLDSLSAFVTMLSYTFQIYFDFSGYCDMALGMARMMNIDLPINFNSPYKSLTILEFWNRWHITLTRFFTKYVYIPLGGNRRGKGRTYINIMIVFIASGFWHGANWTFLLWGMMHGIFSVITKMQRSFFERLPPFFSWFLTFGFINGSWIFFRADSVRDGVRLGWKIVNLKVTGIAGNLTDCFNLAEFRFLNRILANMTGIDILEQFPYFYLGLFLVGAAVCTLGKKNAYERMMDFSPTGGSLIITVTLLLWSICSFSGISTFLYFNF